MIRTPVRYEGYVFAVKEQLVEIEDDVDEDKRLALVARNVGLQVAVRGRVVEFLGHG
jgi:hypothetical protein